MALMLAGGLGFGAIGVTAEDDDEFWHFWEERSDDEYDDDDEEYRYEKYEKKVAPAIKPAKTREATNDAARAAAIFQEMRDSDRDGFMDAYDRYPGKNDMLYVMDSDHDGVSDAEDQYVGANDFTFMLSDANENGIADEIEVIIKYK